MNYLMAFFTFRTKGPRETDKVTSNRKTATAPAIQSDMKAATVTGTAIVAVHKYIISTVLW